MKKNIIIIAALVIAAFGIWYGTRMQPPANPAPSVQKTEQPTASVLYVCNGGKTIDAAFYRGEPRPSPVPGEPPVPTGRVTITLSDGREMTLQQTISASGIRYSNGDPSVPGDESFVFWSKGNGAFVLENNEEQSYIGCIQVVPDPGNLPQIYESGAEGFSLRYPAGYAANANYRYELLGPGKEIGGASFTIPASTAKGTNLGPDTYLSVEEIPNAKECAANLFLGTGASGAPQTATVTDGDVTYSVASSTDAGAGNRYEETVYAVPGTNPCIAIRYFIHYSVFENYPPGAVKEFDRQALLSGFDAIRRTLTIQ